MLQLKTNTRSINAKIEKATKESFREVEIKLKDFAQFLAFKSPVDTGAYAESWSVTIAGSGSGRSKSSKGRTRRQDSAFYQTLAFSNMYSDIDSIDLKSVASVSFKNRAPHGPYVEGKHQIISTAKDRYRGS